MQIKENPKEYDVIIVGSGAGGGMATKILSEAGLSIALSCDFRYASENAFAIAGYGKIALTGDYDSQLSQIGDVSIRIPSTHPQRIHDSPRGEAQRRYS